MTRKEATLLALFVVAMALLGVPGGIKQMCWNVGLGLVSYVIGKVW